jgi:type I restriction enzyme S subunit
MSSRLKPYPAMKDSGVPWLGEVPEHWAVLPNRALFSEVKERDHPDEQMLSVTITKGVIPQKTLLEDSSKKDGSNQDRSAYKLVCPGDIAYNKMRAWQGAIGASELRGIVSPAYVVVRPRDKNCARYFHHLFRTPQFAKEAERWSYGITSDMWSLRPEHFRMIYCVLPPPEEQTAAVRFLDHADRRIRRFIAAKRRLIELLNEQKQAIIQKAVTRGLDPNVRLKRSGIHWLGDVPNHWEPVQVRRIVSLVTSGSRGWAQYYSDDGKIFLQSGNLGRSMALDLSFVQHVSPPEDSEGMRTRVRKDDLLLCITGALTGNVALVDVDLEDAYVNQHVALVRPRRERVDPRFLAYVLHSGIGRTQFKTSEYGGTKQGLGLNAHLDALLDNLTTLLMRAQHEIDLVREYRVRLIADVVTGKLDVRGVELPPLEGAEEPPPVGGEIADDATEEGDELEPVEESADTAA